MRLFGALPAVAGPALYGGLALALAALGSLADPVKPVNILGALLSRLAAALTASDACGFFSLAFTATLLQGYAHFFTGQPATLLRLQGGDDKAAKIRFEWSHVTYFPVFVAHTVHEKVVG